MRTAPLEIALFVLVLVALFVWAGEAVTRASGGERRAAPAEGVSVENGRLVFWGPGKCHTCHAVGSRGTSVRGPNLGASADGPPMAPRAVERARQRSGELGRELSPTDYLVESLTDPSAHVVTGYKDEMPAIHEPPIGLTPDQLVSVVLYLQSLGGEPDRAAIALPADTRRGHGGSETATGWEPYVAGDSARGRDIFFDPEGPAACGTCHRVGGRGGEVGPELTEVAGTRSAEFILESLLEPSARIASGYETLLVETADGRLLDGVVVRETADSVWLADATAERLGLARGEIARSRVQETSVMPGDLAESLSVRELRDLVAFLRTLR